jgi:hypothetical protein
MYISGGSVLIKGTRFEMNNTSGSGSFYNAASAWIFASSVAGSEFKNNTGGGIVNAGTLKLANVTIANNGAGIINGGTLSGTNLTITNSSPGISNSNKMAITNAAISSGSTGVNVAGGVTVLANTVLAGNSTGLSFALGHGGPDDIAEQIKGCILFNVNITGGGTGISASYSSSYSNHRGGANLLLNSVRISGASGAGLALSHTINNYGTNPPRDNRGLYVTLNNVTITGNGGGITSSAKNIAIANAADRFDVLNLRVRNSIILGNGTQDTARSGRFAAGSFGFDLTQANLSGNNFFLNPDKAPFLAAGSVFRIAKGNDSGALRTPVYIVTGTPGNQITFDATPVYTPVYTAGKTEGFALGDVIVKTYFTESQFELGATDIAPDISAGENTWYLNPAHGAQLHVNDVFKMGNGTAATGSSFNTVRSITPGPKYTVQFTASAADSLSVNKHIMTDTVTPVPGVPGVSVVNLAGHTEWENTMIGGVDRALTGTGLITGIGVSAAAVFGANFRIRSARTDLINRGENSFYPIDSAALVRQCYGDPLMTPGGWGYKFKGGGTVNQESAMTDVLNNWLYTWLKGVYEKVTDITSSKTGAGEISLGNDNGGDKGDQRSPVLDGAAQNRKNGFIDVGAYEN